MLIFNHDYKGKCWWCGDPADSAEHKHKRSDLVREFGPGPYTGPNQLVVHRTGLPSSAIGGPNSRAAKFDKNLCQRCNNQRSQPFDRAYDEFVAHLDKHSPEILRRRVIDLTDIWGSAWPAKRHDLLRYWIKLLACRAVHDRSIYIAPAITDYLNGGRPPADWVVFDLTIWGEVAAIIQEAEKHEGIDRFGFVGISPTWVHPDPQTGDPVAIEGAIQIRWFRVHWYYGRSDVGFGDPFASGRARLPVKYDSHQLRARLIPGRLYNRLTGRALWSDLQRLGLVKTMANDLAGPEPS